MLESQGINLNKQGTRGYNNTTDFMISNNYCYDILSNEKFEFGKLYTQRYELHVLQLIQSK